MDQGISPTVAEDDIQWPNTLTISWAKQLAKAINRQMGIGHSRALHAVAIRYGYDSWIACRAALETQDERAEKRERDMWRQQRRARKWADGNAARAQITESLAIQNPDWVGKRTATAGLDGSMRPADGIAATVIFHPHKMD